MLDDDLELSHETLGLPRANRAGAPTRGWPNGETVGPCREWHDTMWTSSGRYFSNAAFSGALTDVWPETIAPTLVAARVEG